MSFTHCETCGERWAVHGTACKPRPNSELAGSNGWNVCVERLKRRREYWLTCKEDAIRAGSLCNAGGFDCRAKGLSDAIQIMEAIEEEEHSNGQKLSHRRTGAWQTQRFSTNRSVNRRLAPALC